MHNLTLLNIMAGFWAAVLCAPASAAIIVDGSLDAAQRANVIWKKMLAAYEAPPIDPGVDEALLEFIARRKASMPDSEV